jgi:hypothetical protein
MIAGTVRFASAQGRQPHGQEEAGLMKPTSKGIILPGGRPSHVDREAWPSYIRLTGS